MVLGDILGGGSNCKKDKEQMIKRVFDILTFPFYLIYLLISFPFKIAKIIIDDKNEKRKNCENETLLKTKDEELIEIGQLLFSEYFQRLYSIYEVLPHEQKNISH